MPFHNKHEILRLTPEEVNYRAIHDCPALNVKEQNELNEKLRPGEVTQMVYIDNIYRGICLKREKLWQVIDKFSYFLK